MSNPNFVNDLVMMAKAFEELPTVKAALEAKSHDFDVAQQMIQRLELRLIDAKNEIDAAHAATRKAEVERDHAETMFLETDSKLDQAKAVLNTLIGNAGSFLQAVEPPKPEPVAEPEPTPGQSAVGESTASDTTAPASAEAASQTGNAGVGSEPTATEQGQREGGPTAPLQEASHSQPSSAPDVGDVSAESVASSTMGESATDPIHQQFPNTSASPDGSTATDAPTADASSEAVSVPTDPTQATESSSTNVSDALASPQPEDDVGYHNEPSAGGDYLAWSAWCDRMIARYGHNNWPARPTLHGDREAAAQ
jgi:hypothetical protein